MSKLPDHDPGLVTRTETMGKLLNLEPRVGHPNRDHLYKKKIHKHEQVTDHEPLVDRPTRDHKQVTRSRTTG
jgi:hypothetical protein